MRNWIKAGLLSAAALLALQPAPAGAARGVQGSSASSAGRAAATPAVPAASRAVVRVESYRAMESRPLHRRGAGVLLNKDGVVLTPSFVVDESSSIYVTLANGKKAPAELLGIDEASSIAMLQVSLPAPARSYPRIASSQREEKGAPVRLVVPGRSDASLRGKVTRTRFNIGPLSEVTEVRLEGALENTTGGVALGTGGELVGLILGSTVKQSAGRSVSYVYIVPSSRIVDAIGRVAGSVVETERQKPVRPPASPAPRTLI